MRPTEKIEKLVKNVQIETNPQVNKAVLSELCDELDKVQKEDSTGARLSIWRIIMKSRMTKFAAAAVIIIAVVLSLTFLEKSVTDVYAIEQTIEAVNDVVAVHIFGRGWDEKGIEMWVGVNHETGMMEYCYMDEPEAGRLTVSTPQNTYYYDKGSNTVRIKDGPSISSIFRLGKLLEDMIQLNKRFNGVTSHYETFDSKLQRSVIVVEMISQQFDLKARIDPDTKLPISINVVRGQKPSSREMLKHADEIYYSESLPEELFDFKIPEGAKVVLETIDEAEQQLPESVIEYAVQIHLVAWEEMAIPKGILVNTQLYLVDKEFSLIRGGFLGVYNYSNETWTGEVSVANFDYPNLAVFDENGKKQKIRMVQRKSFSPGRFRLYWQLDEPLLPGQAKGGIYWINNPKKLNSASEDLYPLRMSNTFGSEALENFILILPENITVRQQSASFISHDTIDGFNIYVWQKHLPPQRIDNVVNVSLGCESP